MMLYRADARTCSPACRKRAQRKRAAARIPAEMVSKPHWIRRTRTKRPVTIAGKPASSTDSSTWSTYADAMASTAGAGLGFVLNGDGLAALDLDHCLTDGKPTEAAQRVLEAFPGAWVEVSPSGTGLHIWGTAPSQPGRKITTADGLSVEFYTSGRYITVTGQTYRPGGLTEPLNLERITS